MTAWKERGGIEKKHEKLGKGNKFKKSALLFAYKKGRTKKVILGQTMWIDGEDARNEYTSKKNKSQKERRLASRKP